jgi:Fic family protein
MSKKVIYYKKLLQSGQAGHLTFINSLSSYYNEKPTELTLKNFQDNNFVIYKNALKTYLDEYNNLSSIATGLRTSTLDEYLRSGYLTSEINSSLRVEGVHSTMKIVDQIINQKKKEGIVKSSGEIQMLINNMYESLRFIINGSATVSERNIFILYSLLTKEINANQIEDNNIYRQTGVTVGDDHGANASDISSMINTLCDFINADNDLPLIIKALISHYYFELIHPYYDYNGRMGRLIHL